MLKNEDYYAIKPNKGFIIFWLFAVMISLYYVISGERNTVVYHHNFHILYPIVSSLLLYINARKYVLHREGIWVYLLGIKIKTVYWHDVREVYIVHQKYLGSMDYRVYFFRNGSPYAGRDPNQIGFLSVVHPFVILSAMIWDGTISECKKTIEQHYNAPDFLIVIEEK